MFKKAVECFHQLNDRDVRTVVNELMIRLGGVGPGPRIGEGLKLRLAYSAAWLAKETL